MVGRLDRLKTAVEQKIGKAIPFRIDRAKWVTESYRRTEGEPMVVRRAKAVAHALAKVRIDIQPDELIVGTQAVYEHYEFPEFWPLPQDATGDLRAYWDGRDIRSVNLSQRTPDMQQAVDDGLFVPHIAITAHLTANFPVGIERGVHSLLDEIRERRPAAAERGRREFYDAAQIACEGLLVFAARYADLADRRADTESDSARASELREIARICRKVPGQPAETLHEAIQSQWLIHTAIQLESVGGGYGMGAVDRTFYPFLRDDLASGRLTVEQAQELIDCFWLKLIECNAQRFSAGDAVMLCGYDADGNEVANDLSRACLNAAKRLYWPSPALYVRVTPDLPDDIRRTCMEMLQEGRGYPVLLNEPLIRECFARVALRPGDECRIGALGCAELSIAGAWRGWVDNPWFNLAKCLERSLSVDNGSGLRRACSFEVVLREFEAVVRRGLQLAATCEDTMDRVCGELVPAPLLSVFMDDCLDRGDDVTRDGARYRSTTVGAVGIPNVADSLAAIKKLVFEEPTISAGALADALETNYANSEALRHSISGCLSSTSTASIAKRCARRRSIPTASGTCWCESADTARASSIWPETSRTTSLRAPRTSRRGAVSRPRPVTPPGPNRYSAFRCWKPGRASLQQGDRRFPRVSPPTAGTRAPRLVPQTRMNSTGRTAPASAALRWPRPRYCSRGPAR